LEQKPTQKRKIKFQNRVIRKEKAKNKKKGKIKNMSQFEKMTIPGMADGIIDDQEQFEEQQRRNEAQLEAEIEDSKDSSLDSLIGYDDRVEFVPFKEVKMSPEQLAKLAKRRQVIGHALLSKLAS
jgi:hypothetical protein